MLIDFNHIVSQYGKPKGIIHIGAHLMEERDGYVSNGLLNTIWIEANPKVYDKISFINESETEERAFNFAIMDVDNKTCDLNVTNNGQSSSIFELDKHKIYHPQIYVTEVLQVSSKRIDTLFLENFINIDEYDFVNVDIQGAELLALKSFGNLICRMKYVYTEVNVSSLYKDGALMSAIDEYLSLFGFKRVETNMTEYEWGDALYIKLAAGIK